ncbi:ankyrin repeat domain-containing protein [Streptococcus parasanguinis]|uniref:ankyrin repeat domain-containing protein n=1 Tax=Streptococcus parasanguinis TaxID=1318 RepID=UPI00066B33B9|nr:ankyrin repeat domain-containing protein [Streptococcus parasanguinis]MDU5787109.1 ankyrin repeat domain-containing protein [Streptococcus parasanguinis]
MQKTFQLLRRGDLEAIRQILDKKPEEVNAVSGDKPKRDQGQSLLQVAIKSGHLDIADLLIDRGADLNFIEEPTELNPFCQPVIQTAGGRAVFDCRRMIKRWNGQYEMYSSKEKADQSFKVFKKMLELGADISQKDSHGGTLLQNILRETKEVLPSYYWKIKETSDNILITDELRHDLNRIYDLLIRYGVTSEEISAYHKIPLKELYQNSPTMEFLKRLD